MALRETKRARTREALIDAAYALFREQGYDATPVEAIARRAEVSRSTFFRYFETKEAVFFVHQQRRLARFEALVGGGGGFDTVWRACLSLAELYREERDAILQEHAIIAGSRALIAHEMQIDARWEAGIGDGLAPTGATEEERRVARLAAGAVVGVIRAVLREWYAAGGRTDLLASGEPALRLLLEGLPASLGSR